MYFFPKIVSLLILCATSSGQDLSYGNCYAELSCFNYTFSRDVFRCYGHQSCLKTTIDANNSIFLFGSQSNEYSDITFSGNLSYCGGFRACAYAPSIISQVSPWLTCNGPLACIYATISIQNGGFLTCSGDYACAYAHIMASSKVYVQGSYALNGAIVDTANTPGNNVVVRMHGGFYSGHNATVYCREGITCTINCFGNSCLGMNIICTNCTNLEINCNETMNILCPYSSDYYFVYSSNISSYEEYMSGISIVKIIDYFNDSSQVASNCELTGAITYDNAFAVSYDDIILNNVINSTSAMINSTSISDNDNYICCRGRYSCRGITGIVNNNDIMCLGGNSCIRTTIYLISDNTYDTFNITSTLYCSSYFACTDSIIYGNKMNSNFENTQLYISGYAACYNCTIEGIGTVYCHQGSGNAACNGEWKKIQNAYFLGRGWSPADGIGLTIRSANIGTMNLYFWGWTSAHKTTIICHKNDICNIDCGTIEGACNSTSTKVYCKGTCNIYCNDTAGFTCPDIRDPSELTTFAPTLIPSAIPSFAPTDPTVMPSMLPSLIPSIVPTGMPTVIPSTNPSFNPTIEPTRNPTKNDTIAPTAIPTQLPTKSGIFLV